MARSPHPLGAYPRAVTDWLDHWAGVAPDRVFLAEREGEAWRKLTYAEAREAARSIAQGLIDRGLSVDRPVAILSGNSVDHALVGLGAMIAGVPYAPVSTPYSLIAKDFAKLKAIIALLTPGLVFVSDGAPFAAAIDAAVPRDVEVVARVNPPASRPSATLASILAKPAGPEVDAAQAKVGPDTIAKLLFTSGSTGTPKGVINTHRMMTSNQAMLRGVNPSYGAEPPVLIDWLPWSHTFGGNNNFNLVLANGGSYFIDEGRPLPGLIEATVRNLREISPTVYYNVPRGFEMLLPALQADRELRLEPVLAAAGVLLRRRGALAPCPGRVRAARARDRGRGRAHADLVRLDRDRPLRDQRDGSRARARSGRHSQPRRRSEARAQRRQARSATEEPEHHPGLLASAGADRGGVRRGRLLSPGRRAALRRRARPRTGLHL